MDLKQKFLNILVSAVISISPLGFAASIARAEETTTETTPVVLVEPETTTATTNETPVGTTEQPVATPQTVETQPTTTENPTPVSEIQEPILESAEARWWREHNERRDARRAAERAAALAAATSLTNTNDTNPVPLSEIGCVDCPPISVDSLNSNTGQGSTNTASNTLGGTSNTTVNNTAGINNTGVVNTNTGHNSADANTGDGGVETGDSDIWLTALNVGNSVNVGYQVTNVFDDQTGDLVIDYGSFTPIPSSGSGSTSSNDTTGQDSSNDASNTSDSSTTFVINNDGQLLNDYVMNANTGYNTADMNTGDGGVVTGDANVNFNLINFLNNNFIGGAGELLLGVVNIFGNLTGDIVLQGLDGGEGPTIGAPSASSSNSTTGQDSSNSASNDISNQAEIILNNNADVLNGLTLNATTGNNDASKNTGGGTVTTGDVNANAQVGTIANTNTVGNGGGTIWMVLVNNLGNWTGQLFSNDSTGGTYSPFFTFSINPDGTISADNSNTGQNSDNTASNSINNDSSTTINNDAAVANNVVINANTGGNSASKNTGSGSISTGNVNVAANILNILNNNFVASRFVLTIVNVFGGFFGNIRDGEANLGTLSPELNSTGQIAVSSSGGNVTSKQKTNSQIAVSSNSSTGSEGENSLVLSASTLNKLPTAHFNADKGLLGNFKLEYLLIPLIIAASLTIFRRVLVRR